MSNGTEYPELRPPETDALRAWAHLIDSEAAQVGRVREPEPEGDFYAPVAGQFRPGVRHLDELDVLLSLTRPDETWLDIGAGGGRITIPVAQQVQSLIAVDPSESMRSTLAESAEEAGCHNLDIRDVRWPIADWTDEVDVSLASHAVYDIRDIGAFLDAMEACTRRMCVAVLGHLARGAQYAALFEELHGEPYISLPALREFVALLGARGRRYEVHTAGRLPAADMREPEQAYELVRRLMWLAPGSPKDQRMRELLHEWYGTPEGIALPAARRFVGVVTWEPPER